VHDLVHEVRASPGVRFVPADLKGVREALAHVRKGGVLAILADRDIMRNGPPVTFFGERARLPSGPIELALRTHAPVLPAFVLRASGDRYRVFIDPPLDFERTGNREADLAAGMRNLAATLEVGIRRAPEQWFPLQPIWSGLAL
jgi:KDO2-lipid IV(A) lauroyltransferase